MTHGGLATRIQVVTSKASMLECSRPLGPWQTIGLLRLSMRTIRITLNSAPERVRQKTIDACLR